MIEFESFSIEFTLKEQESVRDWLLFLIKKYGEEASRITYVFMSDEELLKINQEYLQHDYYTDIITFPFHDSGSPIESDIYISVDRVRDNANNYDVDFEDELHRVMVHGVLHLLGFDDHSEEDRKEMRKAEANALSFREWKSPRG